MVLQFLASEDSAVKTVQEFCMQVYRCRLANLEGLACAATACANNMCSTESGVVLNENIHYLQPHVL